MFYIKSILFSIGIFTLTGFVLALILTVFFGSNHPHNMDEMLYAILPLMGVAIGFTAGIILSLVYRKSHDFKKVLHFLIISSVATLIATFLAMK